MKPTTQELQLHLKRTNHTVGSTTGELLVGINGLHFCYTLEDVIRGSHIKISKCTGIAPGDYFVKLTYSTRFKRVLPLIYSNTKDFSCDLDGKRFTGIRFHGGNTSEDTEGCPLVAFVKINNERIQGKATDALVELIEKHGGEAKLRITN